MVNIRMVSSVAKNATAGTKPARDHALMGIRRDPDELRAVLDTLDRNADYYGGAGLRDGERHQYRVSQLRIDIVSKDGSGMSLGLPTRNISRDGMSVIASQYIHLNTKVVVHLLSLHNRAFPVAGCVAHCRYLLSTSGLYEIGIKFDRPIDLAIFQRLPPRVNVLLLSDDAAEQRMIEKCLERNLASVRILTSGSSLAATVVGAAFDLVLVDADKFGADVLNGARQIRAGGCWVPMIALTSSADATRDVEFAQSGITTKVVRPLSKSSLLEVIQAYWRDPMFSALVSEPEALSLIDDFVLTMPERLVELETSIAKNLSTDLQRCLSTMLSEGEAAGFDFVAQAARQFLKSIGENADAITIRKHINEMVAVGKAIRGVGCNALS